MALLDHFRPPLVNTRHWKSFHASWAYEIARMLNRDFLRAGYLAEPHVTIGTQLQVDIASFKEEEKPEPNGAGGTATAVQKWAPPAAPLIMPAVFPDDIEVQVFETEGGSRLVGAIELVSPRNKDRPDSRRGFAAKCATYLQRGIGVVIVDIVTTRQHNLHDELVSLLGLQETLRFPSESLLYAVAYRPSTHNEEAQIEVWPFPLALGQDLPMMPLYLRTGPTVPLDLETPYRETRAGLGL